jgi:hypothetical protein
MRLRRSFALLLATLASPIEGPALAQGLQASGRPPAPQERILSFDIPAQPLSSTIEAYVVATGVQVLYDQPPGQEPRSRSLHGAYTPTAALKFLLAGTGLEPRFQDSTHVVLEPPRPATPERSLEEPPPETPTLSLGTLEVRAPPTVEVRGTERFDPALYRSLIQREIRRALALNPDTATGAYTAVLRLWIAPTGVLQTVQIAQSTGNLKRDAAICRVLSGLLLQTSTPSDIPQPVVVRIDAWFKSG